MAGQAPGAPWPGVEDVATVADLARLLRALRRREARRRGGSALTYRELAAKTGWSRGIIGEYFAGNVLPPTDRFDVLIRLLGAGPGEQGALATARDRVEENRRGTPAPERLLCPYRGLSAFRERDAALFFGREDLTDRLVREIEHKSLVAVVGPSGAGKSSLVFAGAVPRLRSPDWTVTELRPAEIGRLEPTLTRPGFAEVVERVPGQHGTRRLLLIVDQFEEIYAWDAGVARQFVDALLEPDAAVTVVLTLRADFLGTALDHAELAQRLQDSMLMVGRMTRAQLRRVIEGPLPEPVKYESGLVERILADVGDEAGCLTLLEFALTMLWERRRDHTLSHAAYEELGGVAGSLARYAEDVFHRELKAVEEPAARLFVQLVRPNPNAEPTRRVARRTELDASLWSVAQRLAATRLVITGCDDTGTATVELAHEALISAWDRLRRWVEADRDFRGWQERLRIALEQFEASGRDPGTLLRGMPLAEAERWLAERGADIGPAEQAYIRSSRGREGRAVQRLRGLIAGLVILLVVAVTLGINADRQRGRLRQDERLATSQALAAQADATMESRPVVSLLLSVQAFNEADTAEARGSLLRQVIAHTHTNGFLIGHTSRVSGVAFSRDGHTVATASVDGTARLWDATTHREMATLAGHTNWLRAVAFSPDGRILASGGDDDTARLWDVGTHREVATLAGHAGPVRAVAFSPDGRTLATASDDGTARLWDVSSHQEVATLARQGGAVRTVAFSPDGRTLATAGADGVARLWDVGTRRQVATLTGHADWIMGVAFSPDGRTLATASADHTVRLWSVADRRQVATLTGHTDVVLAVAFSPDGRTLATASADRTARRWDVATGRELDSLTGHGGWVTGIAYSPDGRTLATSSDDLTARLWDVTPQHELVTLTQQDTVTGLGFSRDARFLATAGGDGTLRLWDVAAHRVSTTLGGHPAKVSAVTFSPDGRTVAAAGNDTTVRLWDVATHRELATLQRHAGPVRSVAFSPDGRILATSGDDRTVRLWDLGTRDQVGVLTGHTDRVGGATFSPDGRILATASDDRTVRLWDVAGRRQVATLSGHTDKVSVVAFGPDGRTLATAGEDATVRLWDVATHREVATLTGHTGWVWAVVFSPDGRTLATAADDATVRAWDVAARRQLAVIGGHSDTAPRLALSPDGRVLAAIGTGTTVRLWDMNVLSWRRQLCDLAGRNLTRVEWEEFLRGRPYQKTCPDRA